LKIIALGTTKFLSSCVHGLIEAGCVIQGLVSLPKELLPDNSINVGELADEIGSEYFETDDINSVRSINYIKTLAPDIIFSSWPKIIGSDLLSVPVYGVIGTHPTALPFNKGRHPLQWQIVLGLRESLLSYFWMDSGVDSGPIILQIPYGIEPDDTISSLSERLNTIAFSASRSIGERLISIGVPNGVPQDLMLANVWRKRDRHDVLIDFRMNGNDILALIRSFSEPYPCATILFEDHLLHILSGEKIEPQLLTPIAYLEPGKVVRVEDCFLEVKSASTILRLRLNQNAEQILGSTRYIHPPSKYLARNSKFSSLF
jgi:methionyl-tRNA formyltransferase